MIQVVTLSREELDKIIGDAAKRAAQEAVSRMPPPGTRPVHVNYTQAAEMLGLSSQTVSKLVREGLLKLNKCGLIPISEVDKVVVAR